MGIASVMHISHMLWLNNWHLNLKAKPSSVCCLYMYGYTIGNRGNIVWRMAWRGGVGVLAEGGRRWAAIQDAKASVGVPQRRLGATGFI